MADTPLIEAKALQVGIDRPLFDGLDLTIRPGSVWVIRGDNGSGKTTLLRCLAGELPPLGGRLERRPELRTRYLPQHGSNRLTGPFHVGDFLALAKLSEARHPWIPDNRRQRLDRLSGGQRQRLLVACALLTPCDLLLLDEPSQYMDAPARELLHQWLFEHETHSRATSIVLVSHDEQSPRIGNILTLRSAAPGQTTATPDTT